MGNMLVVFLREEGTGFYIVVLIVDFYALADDHVRTILGQGMEHVNEPD